MKKRQILKVFLAFSFMLTGLYACNSNTSQNNSTKPESTGPTGEILIVLQKNEQWSGPIGMVIKKYFEADTYGLPQPQPLFVVMHIKKDDLSEIFRIQRNILLVNIDPKVKKPEISIERDLWAVPQLIINMTAPSEKSFVDVFKDHHNFLEEEIIQSERSRIHDYFSKALDTKVMQKIQNSFKFTLDIPTDFYVAKTKPGFMWIRHETEKSSQGIIIISSPYTDTTQFSRESILSKIQKYQREYIPGPSKGSYMTLDRKYMIPKYSRTANYPTKFAAKIVGLWRVENDFMGGPFISYTFLHPKTKQIVTLFGYVYYPNHSKRTLLMQVETMLHYVNFTHRDFKKKKKK